MGKQTLNYVLDIQILLQFNTLNKDLLCFRHDAFQSEREENI